MLSIVSVSNPVYLNAESTAIDCDVVFSKDGQNLPEMPFMAAAADTEPHGIELWSGLIAGDYGDIAPYSAPVESLEHARDRKIKELTTSCRTTIIGGFTSNAVDDLQAYNYDSRDVDQINLSDLITALEVNGGTLPVVCNDPSGQLGFIERPHTLTQAKKVKYHFVAFRISKSQLLTQKIATVNDPLTDTISKINAISWP